MRMRKRKWVDSFLENEDNYLIEDIKSLDTKLPVYLEIGMGMGDFIVNSANQNKDIFYVGLEKEPTCVARAIKKAQELELENLRISHIDAANILEHVNPSSIDRIYLHFSDPWPKKHHHKRRLTYPSFLNIYDQILKPDGTLIFKTDNEGLFKDSLEYFDSSNFVIEEKNEDYHAIKRNEPMTGYEAKFVEAKKPIYYVKLRKV